MPAKSKKQLKYIYAMRNKYGSRKEAPKNMKWLFGKEWTKDVKMSKLKENILSYSEFINENKDSDEIIQRRDRIIDILLSGKNESLTYNQIEDILLIYSEDKNLKLSFSNPSIDGNLLTYHIRYDDIVFATTELERLKKLYKDDFNYNINTNKATFNCSNPGSVFYLDLVRSNNAMDSRDVSKEAKKVILYAKVGKFIDNKDLVFTVLLYAMDNISEIVQIRRELLESFTNELTKIKQHNRDRTLSELFTSVDIEHTIEKEINRLGITKQQLELLLN